MAGPSSKGAPKVVVVMPAYNAGRTLRMTYEELPKDTVNLVILVDDGSTDATLEVARDLGRPVLGAVVHQDDQVDRLLGQLLVGQLQRAPRVVRGHDHDDFRRRRHRASGLARRHTATSW